VAAKLKKHGVTGGALGGRVIGKRRNSASARGGMAASRKRGVHQICARSVKSA